MNFLEEIKKAKNGRFGFVEVHLRGQFIGGRIVNDHAVRVHFIFGFKYDRMLKKSINLLSSTPYEKYISLVPLQYAFYIPMAVEEIRASLERSISGTQKVRHDQTERIRNGIKRYLCIGIENDCRCRNCTGASNAPIPGTIYVKGRFISSRTVKEAEFVHEKTSSTFTIVKNIIYNTLPISKFRKFALAPNEAWKLHLGGCEMIISNGVENEKV